MADINEEQLLNELLREVGSADRHMSGADLEARVLAAWDSGVGAPAKRGREPFRDVINEKVPVPFSRYAFYAAIAAMVTLAVMLPTLWTRAPGSAPVTTSNAGKSSVATLATEQVIAPVRKPAAPSVRAGVARRAGVASRAPDAPLAPVAPVSSPMAQAPIEFIPLMPMTESELIGSFQIVRVQMPRASLGPLASPTSDPRELVEADVLLGEDGMARGIRLSTNGSVYPWRPK